MLGHSKKPQVWTAGPWGSLEAALTPREAPGNSWDAAPQGPEVQRRPHLLLHSDLSKQDLVGQLGCPGASGVGQGSQLWQLPQELRPSWWLEDIRVLPILRMRKLSLGLTSGLSGVEGHAQRVLSCELYHRGVNT